MSRPSTRTRIAACFLSLLCLAQISQGQTRHFRGHKEIIPYTLKLPAIDKVELLKVKAIEGIWSRIGPVETSKVIEGSEAQKIASLWRAQTFRSYSSICHNPVYAIRFYSAGRPIVYASLCWMCNNIGFITPQFDFTQGFNGESRRGQDLLQIFRRAFPESKGELGWFERLPVRHRPL